MEDKVISFGKGIHREPSLGSVGELSECVNLYSEAGEMKLLPRMKDSDYTFMSSSDKVLYLHKNSGEYTHYICHDTEENKLKWNTIDFSLDDDGEPEDDSTYGEIAELNTGEAINDITSIGNVLVVATNEKAYYFLWVDGEYRDYSLDSIGDLDIRFSLKGEYVHDVGDSVKIVNLRRNTEDTQDEYDSPVSTYYNGNTVPNKQFLMTHNSVNKGYYEKGRLYKVTLEGTGPTENWNYAVIPLHNDFVFNTESNWESVSKHVGTGFFKDEYMNFYLPKPEKNGGYNWVKTWKDKNEDKVIRLWNEAVSTDELVFSVPFDCNRVYIACFTQAKRDITASIKPQKVSAEGYQYAIDKTASDGIDSLWGNLWKYVKTYGIDKNKFIYPFFVRYAIEMVDGTMIKPSAPILMIPNSGTVPNCTFINFSNKEKEIHSYPDLTAICCDLEYQVLNDKVLGALKSREQVIRGIVIAVSQPIYTVDYDADAETINSKLYLNPLGESGLSGVSCVKISNMPSLTSEYKEYTKKELDEAYFSNAPKFEISVPVPEDYAKDVESASEFYIVKRVELNDLNTTKTQVEMEYGALNNLVARKRLEDNTMSLKAYNAETLYPYNNRLTFGNLKETIFKGYNPELMNGFIDGTGNAMVYAVTTVERNNEKLLCGRGTVPLNGSKVKWFYYPDPKAKTATIQYGADASNFITLELKEHPSLNGAYYYGGLEAEEIEQDSDASAARVRARIPSNNTDFLLDKKSPFGLDRIMVQDEIDGGGGGGNDGIVVVPKDMEVEDIPDIDIDEDTDSIVVEEEDFKTSWNDISPQIMAKNKVVSSVINNPFAIDGATVSLVGMGAVQKLIANTKALSQGQFGSHPMLAFCSDGIWALSVGSEGGFSAVQPISRDVCNNIGAITQTDNAIVFTTDKGLMLLDGSSVKQMCEHLDNIEVGFSTMNLSNIITSLGMNENIVSFANSGNFVNMLKSCKIMYDYVNKLIWIVDEVGQLSIMPTLMYAVSLVSGEVFTKVVNVQKLSENEHSLMSGVESIVHAYPESIMQINRKVVTVYIDSSGKKREYFTTTPVLREIDKETYEDLEEGWLLTRPIPFDDAYSMKMLYDMKVEGIKTVEPYYDVPKVDDPQTDDDWVVLSSMYRVAVYVSNDRVHWGKLKSLKSRSFKWYRFAIFCRMNDYDRLNGLICRIDKRRGNKLR